MKGNCKQCMLYLSTCDDNKFYKVEEIKETRGLTANAYFYVLQNKLADKLKMSNEELHFNLIKSYSDAVLVTLPFEIDITGYAKYYELYKTGTIKEKKVNQYLLYKSSHEMNTKEFSRLLDGLIEECKQQDIDTKTPAEIEELKGYIK